MFTPQKTATSSEGLENTKRKKNYARTNLLNRIVDGWNILHNITNLDLFEEKSDKAFRLIM